MGTSGITCLAGFQNCRAPIECYLLRISGKPERMRTQGAEIKTQFMLLHQPIEPDNSHVINARKTLKEENTEQRLNPV